MGEKAEEKDKDEKKQEGKDKRQGIEEIKGKPKDIRERTFNFAVSIVRLCQQLSERPGVTRSLGRQLLRAGTSIGANVEEAQAGQSRADFVSKYSIALKEARETMYWLRLLHECENGVANDCQRLLAESDEISRIIGRIIVNTKDRKR
jgi:four helix bundle protein